jgi:protein-S-isoprenylcysteine O-methyltransferase Ste14
MESPHSAFQTHFANNRIRWSRCILAVTVFVALFSAPPRYLNQLTLDLLALTGFLLLVVATLWRVWCLVFIGGSKDGELATTGPYSVVRNPLYVGHFVGLVGFGLAAGLPGLSLSLATLFSVLYPAVVAQEERRLVDVFGERYCAYRDQVPRWKPRWSLFREPATIVASTGKVRQGIFDAMWYTLAFAFCELVEMIRGYGLLPTLF